MNRMHSFLTLSIFFILVITAGCGGDISEDIELRMQADAVQESLIVAVASNMQFAFSEIEAAYASQANVDVIPVYGSTGKLVQQIENGAPYDLIIAADTAYVARLSGEKLVNSDSMAVYALGSMILAVNNASAVEAHRVEDLLDEEITHVAVANPLHAPYGVAAVEVLTSYGLWDEIEPKIVYGENVRQVLQYVQTGDAQAGIIPLALADVPEVRWALIDPDTYEPVEQMLAVVTSSTQQEEAKSFARFILGEDGQMILTAYGFGNPNKQAMSDEVNLQP